MRKKMIELNNILGSKFWVNSEDLSFHNIQKQSVAKQWCERDLKYKNKILQPINKYATNFIHLPQLITKDEFVLRYSTHAEIWIEIKNNGVYALDKTMQRQFYPSKNNIQHNNENCYNASYKFYIPWTINCDINLEIKNIEDSPFLIQDNFVKFNKIHKNDLNIKEQWVNFYFKKNNNILKNEYDIIKESTGMFDIIINNKNLQTEILKFYDKKNY